jgi:PelA/Pel-15E family pectate lyase
MDYLETNPRVDAKKVAVMGFSRLGKAAVWAGAQDQRFALVISNASGAGGLALSKRIFGETVKDITTRFPHWLAGSHAKYAGAEDKLPVDSHELAALIAPRPLLSVCGSEDLWSDPKGEFLSLAGADPVYRLLINKGIDTEEWPGNDKLSIGVLGYFRHQGGHDVSLEDWRAMISFASHHLHVSPPPLDATERYAMRVAMLPGNERAPWQAYFARSDALRRANANALGAELKAAQLESPNLPPHDSAEFKMDSTTPETFFSPDLAKIVISYQLPCGGWSKAIDYSKGPRTPGTQFVAQGHPWHFAGTFDNHSTTEQLKFLVRTQALHPDDAIKASIERGIDYTLAAQTPNGGWPQCFPLEGAYHDGITFNDNAMTNVLELLQLISSGKDSFAWIDQARRDAAASALQRGHAAVLKLQHSIWSPQYDLMTQEVIGARGFELAGLSAAESIELVRYLMKIRKPSKEIRDSIELALKWFNEHQLPAGEDGKPRWARFNDPRTGIPFFPGKRDGRAHADYDEMRKTNPGGYDYFTTKGNELIGKWADKWRKSLK